MDERLRFIHEYRSGVWTMTELCQAFEISRKTGYRLLGAYDRAGVCGLLPRSRRPHTSPTQTAEPVVRALVTYRQRHPSWGPKKLLHYAQRHQPQLCAVDAWPGVSTIARLLAQRGLTGVVSTRKRVWPSATPPTSACSAPNEIWTADYKGEFRTRDGRWCYPLTVMDVFSRYLVGCQALLGPTVVGTQRVFQRLFARYGLPTRIRTDNGTPFAGPGVAGLSPLSVWWIRLGIGVDRIARGHPEQNGSHERMHRTLKAETIRPPAASLCVQQRRFTQFSREYNHERPHEALDFEVPAGRYDPSPRALPSRLLPVDYPGHFEVRRVYAHGDIRIWGRRLFVSEALRGEYVGFEEIDDGIWDLCFCAVRLARLDIRTWCLHPHPTDSNES